MRLSDITPFQHSHSFGQDVKRSGEQRTALVILITATMMIVEIFAGLIFGSMALLADGMHMASHATALFINLFAYIYARRHAHDKQYSFGTGKVNALGGFTGAVLLAVFALTMAWGSIDRLIHPIGIAFNQAIIVAVIGLIVNGVSVLILDGGAHGHHDHDGHDDHEHEDHHHHHHTHEHHDHNLKSAYYHVLADALTSVLAIVALLTAKYFGWIWMDPLMGIVGAILVCRWSLGLLKVTSSVLLDKEASQNLTSRIRACIEERGDSRVADLHLWSIGPNIHGLILSVVTSDPQSPEHYKKLLPSDAGLAHITVEVHGCPPDFTV